MEVQNIHLGNDQCEAKCNEFYSPPYYNCLRGDTLISTTVTRSLSYGLTQYDNWRVATVNDKRESGVILLDTKERHAGGKDEVAVKSYCTNSWSAFEARLRQRRCRSQLMWAIREVIWNLCVLLNNWRSLSAILWSYKGEVHWTKAIQIMCDAFMSDMALQFFNALAGGKQFLT